MTGDPRGDAVPKVSYIMPAYNAALWIGGAISSVLAQTHPDVELIVVDDGSTDETRAIATAFGDRIVLLSQENRGLSSARNLGLAHASGDFIGLCDSDDLLLPNHTSLAIAALRSAPPRSLVTCASLALTNHGLEQFRCFPWGEVRPSRQREAIIQANFVSIFSVFPRELVADIGGFDESMRRCEDWQFWARAILSGWRVVFQPTVSACYRRQGLGLSANLDAMRAAEDEFFLRLREEFADRLEPDERRLLDLRAAHGTPARLWEAGSEAWRRGDYADGSRLMRQASQGQPLDARRRWKARIAAAAAPAVAAVTGLRGGRRTRRGSL